jgi:hypothetical protein
MPCDLVVTRHAGGQLRETWWSQGMLVVNYVKHGGHKACSTMFHVIDHQHAL